MCHVGGIHRTFLLLAIEIFVVNLLISFTMVTFVVPGVWALKQEIQAPHGYMYVYMQWFTVGFKICHLFVA